MSSTRPKKPTAAPMGPKLVNALKSEHFQANRTASGGKDTSSVGSKEISTTRNDGKDAQDKNAGPKPSWNSVSKAVRKNSVRTRNDEIRENRELETGQAYKPPSKPVRGGRARTGMENRLSSPANNKFGSPRSPEEEESNKSLEDKSYEKEESTKSGHSGQEPSEEYKYTEKMNRSNRSETMDSSTGTVQTVDTAETVPHLATSVVVESKKERTQSQSSAASAVSATSAVSAASSSPSSSSATKTNVVSESPSDSPVTIKKEKEKEKEKASSSANSNTNSNINSNMNSSSSSSGEKKEKSGRQSVWGSLKGAMLKSGMMKRKELAALEEEEEEGGDGGDLVFSDEEGDNHRSLSPFNSPMGGMTIGARIATAADSLTTGTRDEKTGSQPQTQTQSPTEPNAGVGSISPTSPTSPSVELSASPEGTGVGVTEEHNKRERSRGASPGISRRCRSLSTVELRGSYSWGQTNQPKGNAGPGLPLSKTIGSSSSSSSSTAVQDKLASKFHSGSAGHSSVEKQRKPLFSQSTSPYSITSPPHSAVDTASSVKSPSFAAKFFLSQTVTPKKTQRTDNNNNNKSATIGAAASSKMGYGTSTPTGSALRSDLGSGNTYNTNNANNANNANIGGGLSSPNQTEAGELRRLYSWLDALQLPTGAGGRVFTQLRAGGVSKVSVLELLTSRDLLDLGIDKSVAELIVGRAAEMSRFMTSSGAMSPPLPLSALGPGTLGTPGRDNATTSSFGYSGHGSPNQAGTSFSPYGTHDSLNVSGLNGNAVGSAVAGMSMSRSRSMGSERSMSRRGRSGSAESRGRTRILFEQRASVGGKSNSRSRGRSGSAGREIAAGRAMSPPMVIHSASPDAVGVNVMGSSSSVSGSVQNNNNDNNNMMGVGSPSSPFRPKDSRGRSAVRSNPISSNSINNINSISNDNSPMPIPSSHSALHYDVASTGVQALYHSALKAFDLADGDLFHYPWLAVLNKIEIEKEKEKENRDRESRGRGREQTSASSSNVGVGYMRTSLEFLLLLYFATTLLVAPHPQTKSGSTYDASSDNDNDNGNDNDSSDLAHQQRRMQILGFFVSRILEMSEEGAGHSSSINRTGQGVDSYNAYQLAHSAEFKQYSTLPQLVKQLGSTADLATIRAVVGETNSAFSSFLDRNLHNQWAQLLREKLKAFLALIGITPTAQTPSQVGIEREDLDSQTENLVSANSERTLASASANPSDASFDYTLNSSSNSNSNSNINSKSHSYAQAHSHSHSQLRDLRASIDTHSSNDGSNSNSNSSTVVSHLHTHNATKAAMRSALSRGEFRAPSPVRQRSSRGSDHYRRWGSSQNISKTYSATQQTSKKVIGSYNDKLVRTLQEEELRRAKEFVSKEKEEEEKEKETLRQLNRSNERKGSSSAAAVVVSSVKRQSINGPSSQPLPKSALASGKINNDTNNGNGDGDGLQIQLQMQSRKELTKRPPSAQQLNEQYSSGRGQGQGQNQDITSDILKVGLLEPREPRSRASIGSRPGSGYNSGYEEEEGAGAAPARGSPSPSPSPILNSTKHNLGTNQANANSLAVDLNIVNLDISLETGTTAHSSFDNLGSRAGGGVDVLQRSLASDDYDVDSSSYVDHSYLSDDIGDDEDHQRHTMLERGDEGGEGDDNSESTGSAETAVDDHDDHADADAGTVDTIDTTDTDEFSIPSILSPMAKKNHGTLISQNKKVGAKGVKGAQLVKGEELALSLAQVAGEAHDEEVEEEEEVDLEHVDSLMAMTASISDYENSDIQHSGDL